MREPSAPRAHALRDFQQQLTQRLQQARRTRSAAQSCIAVSTGVRRWLFDLRHTAELLPLAGITPVPFSRDWYLGLTNHRSQLTGVIDLDAFVGASHMPWQTGDRVLALSPALPLRCAIRITQMFGVVDRANFSPLPSGASQAAWRPLSFTDADELHWDWVDLPALMRDPVFLDIARR
jgi:twitching motility protein PilI